MSVVEVRRGDAPVVVGLPHVGTEVPPDVWSRLNDRGRALSDTDWHVDRLHDGLLPGATVVRCLVHRYVVDVNRPPDGASLYPGRATTDLVPLTDFDGEPIWDAPPTPGDVEERVATVHAPYHAALLAEMERVRDVHGVAILWDAHSIRSRIPRLFDGDLPDLNIGTNDGASCGLDVACPVLGLAAAADGFSMVLNGRFKGGWTTRRYGRPSEGWHAIQMEIAQATYLVAEAPPWAYDDAKARRLRPRLAAMLGTLERVAPFLAEGPPPPPPPSRSA